MKSRRALAALAAVVMVASGASADIYGYRVPREQFRDSVHTIALSRLELPPGFDDTMAIRTKFHELIASHLMEYGYALVPVGEYERVWSRMSALLVRDITRCKIVTVRRSRISSLARAGDRD